MPAAPAPDASSPSAPTPLADDARDFLFELLQMPSPTGYEAPGQRVWAGRVRDAADRVEADAYGNCWATIEPKKTTDRTPKLLLEAHADEIGFVVKHVTKEGFLHIDRLGGSDHAIARGKRVMLLGDDGPVLGVIGNTAIHLRERGPDEKVPKLEELFIDVGASSKDEVAARGLRVGHPAVYVDEADMLTETRLIGRALDNRLGGFVIAEVTRRLADDDEPRPAWTVHAANCVQEEIGGNGAKMLAYRLQPDAAVVLDVTHATDSPGIKHAKHGEVTLGAGPSITHGTVNHPAVVQRLMDVAKAEGIPLQHESSSRFSGTDTDVIFSARAGVPSALVSMPMRYMHSTIETVDLADVQHTIDLLTAFARSLKADDAFSNNILD
jgi:endoglucanase